MTVMLRDHYELGEKISVGGRSVVYRGTNRSTGDKVLVKVLGLEYPDTEQLARFRREYHVSAKLGGPRVIRALELLHHESTLAIVFEDIGGRSLADALEDRRPGFAQCLRLAIGIARALETVHDHRIIHKDVNPANLIWNAETGEIKITDFGIATELAHETAPALPVGVLEGTLDYISPEQTGRMNRSVDHRSDLYSLGATLYHVFTGECLFTADDPLELVHSHLALKPIAPCEHNPANPRVLSDIIMKLLEKRAEDRYQSATAVRIDLETCLERYDPSRGIEPFEIGTAGASDWFQIPEKLYGREAEVGILLETFERVSRGSAEMLLVVGYSGIGKTALVNEVQKPVTHKRGLFLSGKFDQFKRDVPYDSLVQAFSELVDRLLAEPPEKLAQWRREILDAVGPNARVITRVIPRVELIIGEPPPLEELSASASENRFQHTLGRFIRCFATRDHPLVLFLDDLQWVDQRSLWLVRQLMSDSASQHMLLVCAYRDNEVGPSHPLVMTLEDMAKKGAVIETVHLAPLAAEQVDDLVSETLQRDPGETRPLARLCHERTGGNPFFLRQFLHSLHESALVYFEREDRCWRWNVEGVSRLPRTENVVTLIVDKLRSMPSAVREALSLAACIGGSFELRTLAGLCPQSPRALVDTLAPSIREGLLLPVGDAYKFIDFGGSGDEDRRSAAIRYRFLHDRVQQAAYSLMEPDQEPAVRLKIGRTLLADTAAEELDENLFTLVNHLNAGSDLIADSAERAELVRLNLRAGEKALASAANRQAAQYLAKGLELAPEDLWSTDYDLGHALSVRSAEACYLIGDFAGMDRHIEAVLEHASGIHDTLEAREIKIQALMRQGELARALDVGHETLEQLGHALPRNPGRVQIVLALLASKAALLGKRIEDLADRPDMEDPRDRAASRIMEKMMSPAHICTPNLLPMLVLRSTSLLIRKGNTKQAPVVFSMYGFILCGVTGDMDRGHRFGKLALSLVERGGYAETEARALFFCHAFVNHWRESARAGLVELPHAYQRALENGDLEFAAWLLGSTCWYGFLVGVPLAESRQSSERAIEGLLKLQEDVAIKHIRVFEQMVVNLMGEGTTPHMLDGSACNEKEMLAAHVEQGDIAGLTLFHCFKLFVCYHFGQYELALRQAEEFQKYRDGAMGTLHLVVIVTMGSLTRLALVAEAPPRARRRHLRCVAANQKKLQRWARSAPDNFLHRYHLVEAERARVRGDEIVARGHYERAISLAEANGCLQDEALAEELLGRFWLELGETHVARVYLSRARNHYEVWGARAKVAYLDDSFAELALVSGTPVTAVRGNTPARPTTRRTTRGEGMLDLATVLKASQAIAGKVVLPDVLRTLMRILIENAGAQRGCLIFEREGEFFIEAEAFIGHEEVRVLESVPVTARGGEPPPVPVSVLNYVARTKENIVVADATADARFATDPYMAGNHPKSLLCEPVLGLSHGALLYLENNLATGAFTEERTAVLGMLRGQISISIEKAELYEKLEEKVRERTEQLEVRNEFIRNVFGRYMSSAIVDTLLESPAGLEVGGEKRVITILVADIRGFSSIAEHWPPEQVVAVLNNHLSTMTDIIQDHGGTIDEFEGDGILVFFGAPLLREDDADRAVACALEMLRAMPRVNELNREGGLPEIELGIGLNTGEVVVGNIGSDKRAKYGAVGSNINLCYRIESYTVGGQLFITEGTRSRVRSPLRIDSVLEVEPKGSAETIRIFEIGGIEGRFGVELPRPDSALVTLPQPIELCLASIIDKRIDIEGTPGRITRLSEREAEVASSADLPPLTNLRIRVETGAPEGSIGSIYGKVLRPSPQDPTGSILRFTSVPEQARAYFRERLAEAARVEVPLSPVAES